ncbi:MAG: hypothetical protein WC464_06845 [Bdellovibrionales bacterium]
MRATFFLAALIGVSLAFPAQAASLVGASCSTAGTTQMDTDGATLVACLKSVAGSSSLIWKAMTSNNVTCSSGQAVTALINGVPQCATVAAAAASAPPATKYYTCPLVENGSTQSGCMTYSISSSTCKGQLTTSSKCTYEYWTGWACSSTYHGADGHSTVTKECTPS